MGILKIISAIEEKEKKEEEKKRDRLIMNQGKGDIQGNIIIEDAFFYSKGMKCSGMLYRPCKVKNPPKLK